MMRLFKTVRDDISVLWMALKIAILPPKYNPICIAMANRRKREASEAKKVDDLYEKLTNNYKKALVQDGDEADEIEEQLMVSKSFLRRKAKILSYDFTDFDGKKNLTKVEIDVDDAFNRIFSPTFILRAMLYPFAIIALIILLKSAIECFL